MRVTWTVRAFCFTLIAVRGVCAGIAAPANADGATVRLRIQFADGPAGSANLNVDSPSHRAFDVRPETTASGADSRLDPADDRAVLFQLTTYGLDFRHLSVSGPHAPHNAIRRLPPGPGSAALALSALLAVGAWRLAETTARQMGCALSADWFHTGAPPQVAHSVRLDLADSASAMPWFPVALRDGPDAQQRGGRLVGETTRVRIDSYWAPQAAPRGPPNRPS